LRWIIAEIAIFQRKEASMKLLLFVVICLLIAFSPNLVAQIPSFSLMSVTQWALSSGGNGHWYGIIATQLNWGQARDLATSINFLNQPGYLATITSQSENDYIYENLIFNANNPSYYDEYFLGGFLGTSGWSWVTGEEFGYTNWSMYEPNDNPPSYEPQAIGMWGSHQDDERRIPGRWNNEWPSYTGYWSIIEWGNPGTAQPPTAVPELSSLWLLSIGLCGLALFYRIARQGT
jgi:MFS family permease